LDQTEIALEARQVKVAIRRRHDEDDIDICRQQLRATFACRVRLTAEQQDICPLLPDWDRFPERETNVARDFTPRLL